MLSSLRSYVEVAKPRIVLLLVFTSAVAMAVAAASSSTALPYEAWALALIGIAAGCAGCNAVTSYIDRDIDSIMVRTKKRPLPSRKIDPPKKALYLGIFLIMVSLLVAGLRNYLSFIAVALGVLDNVVVYSLLLKRRDPLNIILGGISGGLPVIYGWAYTTNSINLMAVLMAAIVIVWTPNHIWSLALRFKEDYQKVNVPMLPAIVEEKVAIRFIVATSMLLVILSLALFFMGVFQSFYLLVALSLGTVTTAINLWLFFKPTRRAAWFVFKFSSPYLAVIFLAMMIDVVLRY
ncbi:MAG TPA: heme o synthase [Candidatus Bathyarchaeia archaeon]|nr:heme o synthase [Candidatus Bathyarchaeia archaeon]